MTVIVPTYNRAHSILRAVASVQRQTFQDWEIVVVDDGSTDNTREILRDLHDPRIRIVCHERNRGVNAAKNTGFDQMRGTWFTILDSDDEILGEDALETMLSVPARIDPAINAVTCNCMDSSTGSFSGSGLAGDCFLDWKTNISCCRGEFWGITRASLLGGDRLNEEVRGFEDVLWYKVDRRAVRYYLHAPLRVWHTGGPDRLCKERVEDPSKKERIYASYVALLEDEQEYLRDLCQLAPEEYNNLMFDAGMSFIRNGDRRRAWQVFRAHVPQHGAYGQSFSLCCGAIGGEPALNLIMNLKGRLLS